MTRKITHVFIVLSVLIACTDIIFVLINYRSSKVALNENLRQFNKSVLASFHQAFTATEIRMLQIATFVAADSDIQQLFLQGKKAVEAEGGGPGGKQAAFIRAQLLEQVQAPRDALASSFDFRQLHFHLGPGSLSFLRAHSPHKFGDHMDNVRHTIVAVNKLKQPVSGFETGRVYSGIRGVTPVFATDPESRERVYVGAIEAGTSFEVTLRNVAESQHVNMAVALTVDHLQANVWPEFLAKLFQESPPVSGLMVETSTDPLVGDILGRNLLDAAGRQEDQVAISLNNTPYSVSFMPLRDFLGLSNPEMADVGTIVTWRNIEKEMHTFHSQQKINIIYGILGFCLIELLLYHGLRLSSKKFLRIIEHGRDKFHATWKRVEKSEKLLREAQQIAKMGHWELNIEANTLDWSDEIYRIFGATPQEYEATYEAFLKLVHPEDREFVNSSYTDSVTNKTQYDIEHRIVLPTGEVKWVREIGATEYDQKGEPIRSFGTVHDITEIQALRGCLPICSNCHKIRDDEGYWQHVDQYITDHSAVSFSHGVCRQCSDKLYGGQEWYEAVKKSGKLPD